MKRISDAPAGAWPGPSCRRRGLLFLSLAAAVTAATLPALAQAPTAAAAASPSGKKPFSPQELDQILGEAFEQVWQLASSRKVSLRTAAYMLGVGRVGRATVLGGIM